MCLTCGWSLIASQVELDLEGFKVLENESEDFKEGCVWATAAAAAVSDSTLALTFAVLDSALVCLERLDLNAKNFFILSLHGYQVDCQGG